MDELLELLRVEQELSLRRSPFLCQEVECISFNRTVYARDCMCYSQHERAHRDKVRAALAKGIRDFKL